MQFKWCLNYQYSISFYIGPIKLNLTISGNIKATYELNSETSTVFEVVNPLYQFDSSIGLFTCCGEGLHDVKVSEFLMN